MHVDAELTARPSPFVFWAQTDKHVTLKVDLKDVTSPDVELKAQNLSFSASGHGARGLHDYQFKLNFHSLINPEESGYKITDSCVMFTLVKAKTEYWPKLISSPSKPAWLKIDFDRWTSEDASVDDEENVGDVREDYPEIYENLQKVERGYRTEEWKKVYLVFYNLAQFIGFLYIVVVMALRYSSEGPDSIPSTYASVGNVMKLCTLFQILEIMHPIFGYTKNGVFAPLIQCIGRSIALFALIDSEPRLQTKPVVFYLFIAWSLVELVRYPHYIAQLNNLSIPFLTWLRYTIWIPLYPWGFFCEGTIYLLSIPYFEETKKFSVQMPNAWNITFDMATALRLDILFGLIPAMYSLMTHMYRDRKKRLGKGQRRKVH